MLTKVIPGVKSLQKVAPYLSSRLSSVELVWMNDGWLDRLGGGYIGNHIGAAC